MEIRGCTDTWFDTDIRNFTDIQADIQTDVQADIRTDSSARGHKPVRWCVMIRPILFILKTMIIIIVLNHFLRQPHLSRFSAMRKICLITFKQVATWGTFWSFRGSNSWLLFYSYTMKIYDVQYKHVG